MPDGSQLKRIKVHIEPEYNSTLQQCVSGISETLGVMDETREGTDSFCVSVQRDEAKYLLAAETWKHIDQNGSYMARNGD